MVFAWSECLQDSSNGQAGGLCRALAEAIYGREKGRMRMDKMTCRWRIPKSIGWRAQMRSAPCLGEGRPLRIWGCIVSYAAKRSHLSVSSRYLSRLIAGQYSAAVWELIQLMSWEGKHGDLQGRYCCPASMSVVMRA